MKHILNEDKQLTKTLKFIDFCKVIFKLSIFLKHHYH